MPKKRGVFGEILGGDQPEWRPLETLLDSDNLCGWFMWMFEVKLATGCRLHASKNRWTRRYIHLAEDARHAYNYVDKDRYVEVDLACAIWAAFDGWERADPTPEEFEDFELAVRRACRHAK